jgi:oligoribonuclease NrnB/cAMP/cGMP phosphodiesterase (DHH superfamily)
MMYHVVAHYPCTDGFAAAYAVWRYGKNNHIAVEFHQYSHDNNWPEITVTPLDSVFFVDLAPPTKEVLSFLDAGCAVTVLDHHKSAVERLDSEDEYQSLALYPNFEYKFDMFKSGAQLAWEYFFPYEDVPVLIDYIADRDLWTWKLLHSKEISAFLRTQQVELTPNNFWYFDGLNAEWDVYQSNAFDEWLEIGQSILAVEETHITMLLQNVMWSVFTDYDFASGEYTNVPTVNCPSFFASEVAHRLLQMYPDAPFAACFTMSNGGKKFWSLRSDDTRSDVSAIAKYYGGGGHRNAAGFTQPSPLEYEGEFPIWFIAAEDL